jgi:hypothetical protein
VSKLALIRQYQYSPMAGGLVGKILKGGAKFFGSLFKKKGVQAAIQTGAKIAKNPAVQTGLAVAAAEGASALLSGGGGGGGATGGWGYRRRARGITARELRGYRKVANLLHKEGMVSRRARGRK